jgi:Arc/MetJ family transcription regulator
MLLLVLKFWAEEMKITIALDDDLVASASTLSGIKKRSELLHEALKALISREAARELGSLGGTLPDIEAIPRRQMAESATSNLIGVS